MKWITPYIIRITRVADVSSGKLTGFGYHANESDKLNLHDSLADDCALPPAAAACRRHAAQSTLKSTAAPPDVFDAGRTLHRGT